MSRVGYVSVLGQDDITYLGLKQNQLIYIAAGGAALFLMLAMVKRKKKKAAARPVYAAPRPAPRPAPRVAR